MGTSPDLDPQQWVDQHGDYLYRFALRGVRRTEVAEDLVQETLLAAWRGRAGFAGRASERSWLTSILKRKMIDWLRKSVREQDRVSSNDADQAIDGLFGRFGKWKTYPKEWSKNSPDGGVHREEFWKVVDGCLDKLPNRVREAFVLRHLDEASTDDICRDADITPNNLWVMLHRARLRMWQCLTKNWYGEGS